MDSSPGGQFAQAIFPILQNRLGDRKLAYCRLQHGVAWVHLAYRAPRSSPPQEEAQQGLCFRLVEYVESHSRCPSASAREMTSAQSRSRAFYRPARSMVRLLWTYLDQPQPPGSWMPRRIVPARRYSFWPGSAGKRHTLRLRCEHAAIDQRFEHGRRVRPSGALPADKASFAS